MSRKQKFRYLPVSKVLIALAGLGLSGAACAQDLAASIHGEARGAAYAGDTNVWSGGGLASPAAVARVAAPANPAVRPVSAAQLQSLRLGMTVDEVQTAAGQPLARGGNRRWDYLVEGEQGLFVAAIWFNNENRLWMGKVNGAPSREAQQALAAVPAAPMPARLSLGAERLFDFGSATLRPDQGELDGLAQAWLAAGSVGTLSVSGFTDKLGSEAYNMDLSQRRADAVRSYLIGRGVSAGAISAQGRGAADPVAKCDAVKPRAALIDCLAPNRRVVIEGSAR